jgi:D-alanyl-D-alanine carboxypeptidase (penicillin-binding protein 5/6)
MCSPGRARARLLIIFLGVALALGTLGVVLPRPAAALPALPAAPGSQEPTAYISVDADSGAVIAAKNVHEALPPASTIKLLTALVALERLPLASTVPVSARAAAQPAMKINMTEGSVWKLDDALHALLIVSANDAAYAIAERAGGSIEGFAVVAQHEAERLGLVDTTFADPAGLDDQASFGGGPRTSAYDLAVVARNALAVPEIANTSKTLRYDFTHPNGVGRTLSNHNKGFLTTYSGATGLKTGYTKLANRTLVTSATRDGRTCIAVNMGTWDDTGWGGYLLDRCFAAGRAATGTGATVPPVRAVTADQRLGTYAGLPAALGRPSLGGGTAAVAATAATAASKPSTTSTTSTTKARSGEGEAAHVATEVDAQAASATTAAASGSDGVTLGTVFNVRNAVVFVVVVLLALFLLRRRAVRRQRARRIARQRALAEKRRRRMIDVVELRDRESGGHVRVMRSDEKVGGTRRR